MSRPGFAALLFLAVSFPALAAGPAQLSVTVDTPPRVQEIYGFPVTVTIANAGPEDATNVQLSLQVAGASGSVGCSQTTIARIPGGASAASSCYVNPPYTSDSVLVRAIVHADQTPSDEPGAVATASVQVNRGPALQVSIYPPRLNDPALPNEATVGYGNSSSKPSTNTAIYIELPPQLHYGSGPSYCAATGNVIRCAVDPKADGAFVYHPEQLFKFTIVPDDLRDGGELQFHYWITSDEITYPPDVLTASMRLYRTFVVDNTDDAGPGSLRQTITDTADACTDDRPCKIAFRLQSGETQHGAYVIRPDSPLPPLGGTHLYLDATTQTRGFGDTNPDGPEVMLDGSRLAAGDGVVVHTPCEMQVAGFAIANFPGSGILLQPDENCGSPVFYTGRVIEQNYVGTDPTGQEAAPNTRGMIISREKTSTRYFIQHNVVSGNRRTGIFVAADAYLYTAPPIIQWNTIGLDAKVSKPLGNGGSGIYVSAGGTDTEIMGNYIAFNHEFGVAIDPDAYGVTLPGNSIFANTWEAIDVGLDNAARESRFMPRPTITLAKYDPIANTTTIEVETKNFNGISPNRVHVYANDAPHPTGYGDAQYYLGEAKGLSRTTYRLTVTGNWSGKWAAATSTRVDFYGFTGSVSLKIYGTDSHDSTSELSRALRIE